MSLLACCALGFPRNLPAVAGQPHGPGLRRRLSPTIAAWWGIFGNVLDLRPNLSAADASRDRMLSRCQGCRGDMIP